MRSTQILFLATAIGVATALAIAAWLAQAQAAPRGPCFCTCVYPASDHCYRNYYIPSECHSKGQVSRFATKDGCAAREGQVCVLEIPEYAGVTRRVGGRFKWCQWRSRYEPGGDNPDDQAPPPDGVSPAGPKKPRPGGGVIPPSD